MFINRIAKWIIKKVKSEDKQVISQPLPTARAFKKGLKIFSKVGGSGKEQIFKNAWKYVTDENSQKHILQGLPDNFRVPRDILLKSDLKISGKYHYRFRVTTFNEATGTFDSVYRSLITDNLTSLSEARKELQDKITSSDPTILETVTSFDIDNIFEL